MHWKTALGNVIGGADDAYDKLLLDFRTRMGMLKPVQICTYRTFGSEERVYFMGRVIEENNLKPATNRDSLWNNMLNMYRRFNSHEVRGARLEVRFQGRTFSGNTDNEGYFIIEAEAGAQHFYTQEPWQDAEVELLDVPEPHQLEGPVRTAALVRMGSQHAEYGIISDLDDTVIESFATNRLKMAQTVFLNNSYTRLPFPGVPAFYKALQKGRTPEDGNPIFYVSSSPWNLYDFLIDFMRVHDIPHGPVMLRDTGFDKGKLFAKDHLGHKMSKIERILNTYPDMKFILIGDSGQKDPLVYSEVIRRYQGRILACYIRDVKLPNKAKAVLEIAEGMDEEVPMVLVEDTVAAAKHALKCGYIPEEAITDIVQQKTLEEGPEEQLAQENIGDGHQETVKEATSVAQEIEESSERDRLDPSSPA